MSDGSPTDPPVDDLAFLASSVNFDAATSDAITELVNLILSAAFSSIKEHFDQLAAQLPSQPGSARRSPHLYPVPVVSPSSSPPALTPPLLVVPSGPAVASTPVVPSGPAVASIPVVSSDSVVSSGSVVPADFAVDLTDAVASAGSPDSAARNDPDHDLKPFEFDPYYTFTRPRPLHFSGSDIQS
jgi:hypothetical protein